MPGSVEPVSQRRVKELRGLMSTTWWQAVIVLVPIAAGAGIALVSGSNPILAFVFTAGVVALAASIGTYLLADIRAKSAFVLAWAQSRGWDEDTDLWQEETTPLLRDGDRRKSTDHVCGPLTNGGLAALCHYTYEVEQHSGGSNGQGTTTWDEHEFTVVQTDVDATGIDRLSLHPRSFGDNRLFDRIDSTLTSNRVMELESSELEHEYKLEVADSASDAAVRLVFEPAFMVWCLDQAADQLLVEIEGGVLVVAIPDHSYDADQLDALVEQATTIATRFADAAAAGSRT
jgi:hypothetical protein